MQIKDADKIENLAEWLFWYDTKFKGSNKEAAKLLADYIAEGLPAKTEPEECEQ